MISQGEKILAEVRTNPFGTSTIDIRSRSDLIVARYLIDAMAETERANFGRASTAVAKARELAPEYFEVWRVEAIVHEGEQNFPAALQAYQAAVELEPSSIKVRHALGRFFLLALGDHDAAIEQFAAALVLDSQCVEVQLDLVRAYLYSMRFAEARHLLDRLLARVGALTRVEHRSKAYDLHLQYFTRKAEFHQRVEHSADAALREFENLFTAFGKIPPTAVDAHMKKHLAKAFPTACRCENDLSGEAQKKRLEPIITWLSEFELPMLVSHSPKRQRLRGKVTRVFKFKHFGFISRVGGEELFFHQSQLVRRSKWSSVSEGVEVEFEVGSNKQGDCAIRVRVVDTILENAATGKT